MFGLKEGRVSMEDGGRHVHLQLGQAAVGVDRVGVEWESWWKKGCLRKGVLGDPDGVEVGVSGTSVMMVSSWGVDDVE